jgi:hypothetical protein
VRLQAARTFLPPQLSDWLWQLGQRIASSRAGCRTSGRCGGGARSDSGLPMPLRKAALLAGVLLDARGDQANLDVSAVTGPADQQVVQRHWERTRHDRPTLDGCPPRTGREAELDLALPPRVPGVVVLPNGIPVEPRRSRVLVPEMAILLYGFAGSSSGRTSGSGPENRGSNPCPAADFPPTLLSASDGTYVRLSASTQRPARPTSGRAERTFRRPRSARRGSPSPRPGHAPAPRSGPHA